MWPSISVPSIRLPTTCFAQAMEVEMAFRSSSFSGLRASSMGSIIVIAILLGANVAHSQTASTTNRHNGAPDRFADLAEKLEPAVIAVTSKSAATQSALPHQFGTPDQRGL